LLNTSFCHLSDFSGFHLGLLVLDLKLSQKLSGLL
jgi:hypothetical protein